MALLIARSKAVAAGLMRKLTQFDDESKVRALEPSDKAKMIVQLLEIVNGANRQIDMSPVAGAKTAGQYKVRFSKELNDPNVDFCIVDQSVTGMFERKTRVGL